MPLWLMRRRLVIAELRYVGVGDAEITLAGRAAELRIGPISTAAPAWYNKLTRDILNVAREQADGHECVLVNEDGRYYPDQVENGYRFLLRHGARADDGVGQGGDQ